MSVIFFRAKVFDLNKELQKNENVDETVYGFGFNDLKSVIIIFSSPSLKTTAALGVYPVSWGRYLTNIHEPDRNNSNL